MPIQSCVSCAWPCGLGTRKFHSLLTLVIQRGCPFLLTDLPNRGLDLATARGCRRGFMFLMIRNTTHYWGTSDDFHMYYLTQFTLHGTCPLLLVRVLYSSVKPFRTARALVACRQKEKVLPEMRRTGRYERESEEGKNWSK